MESSTAQPDFEPDPEQGFFDFITDSKFEIIKTETHVRIDVSTKEELESVIDRAKQFKRCEELLSAERHVGGYMAVLLCPGSEILVISSKE